MLCLEKGLAPWQLPGHLLEFILLHINKECQADVCPVQNDLVASSRLSCSQHTTHLPLGIITENR